MVRATLLLLTLGVLPGCWTIPHSTLPVRECWSDPEQLSERSRSLVGVSEDQALEAAERLLRSAWADDARIVRSSQNLSVVIRRERTVYLFLVAYRGIADEAWTITTRPLAGGSSLCVQVRGHHVTDTFVLGAEPVANVIYPASATERSRGTLLPAAQAVAVDFDTFWARLDYLVGLRTGWAACPSSGRSTSAAHERNEFNPLCNALATDPAPPAPATRPSR